MKFGTLYDALLSAIGELRQEGGGKLVLHRAECGIYAQELTTFEQASEDECVCDPYVIEVPGDS